MLLEHQQELRPVHLVRYVADPGWTSTGSARICAAMSAPPGGEDLDSAGSSGVAGTPTFFINGHRQCCAYDIDTLTAAVTTAKAQAQLDVPNHPRSGRPQAG